MSQSVRATSLPITPMSPESFSTVSVIGKGSYAKVLLVKKKDTEQLMALKVVEKSLINSERQLGHLLAEREVLLEMRDSPFFVKVHHVFQSPSKVFFALDYCPGGELFGLLQRHRRLFESHARFYAAQLVLALEALHARDVLYRDLKPENILLDERGYIKLADFGLSKPGTPDDSARTICGTPEYLAPEILCGHAYGKAVDWWTLGCLIYELIVGVPPFYVSNRRDLFRKIVVESPTYPSVFTATAKRLVERLLDKRPDCRLGSAGGAAEIKAHPFFEGIDWTALVEGRIAAPFVPETQSDLGLSNFERAFTSIPKDSLEDTSGMACENDYEGFSWDSGVIDL